MRADDSGSFLRQEEPSDQVPGGMTRACSGNMAQCGGPGSQNTLDRSEFWSMSLPFQTELAIVCLAPGTVKSWWVQPLQHPQPHPRACTLGALVVSFKASWQSGLRMRAELGQPGREGRAGLAHQQHHMPMPWPILVMSLGCPAVTVIITVATAGGSVWLWALFGLLRTLLLLL